MDREKQVGLYELQYAQSRTSAPRHLGLKAGVIVSPLDHAAKTELVIDADLLLSLK